MYREINANFINTFDLLLINRRKRRKETKSDGSKLNLIVRKKRKAGQERIVLASSSPNFHFDPSQCKRILPIQKRHREETRIRRLIPTNRSLIKQAIQPYQLYYVFT